jgi:hypothetical protein
VSGSVISKDSENHRTIRYRYNVGDLEYTGTGAGGRGNDDFDDIRIGQDVFLYYDSSNPSESYLGDPKYQLIAKEDLANKAQKGFLIIESLIFLLLYLFLRSVLRNKRSET